MQDRVPVNPGRVLITPENGSAAYYATMTRADNPTQAGTPLNKASLLKDATAALFGLGTDAVPDDALSAIKTLIDGANANANAKAKIATGSYVGTGKYGSSNPNSLTFDFAPKMIIAVYGGKAYNGQLYYPILMLLNPLDAWVNSYSGDSGIGGAKTVVTWGENTVSWYSTESANSQLNYSGTTCHYIAIG